MSRSSNTLATPVSNPASAQGMGLLPCPFCGGSNLTARTHDIDGWIAHIECCDCGDMTGPMSEFKYIDDEPEAIADASRVWNRRVSPAPSRDAAVPASGGVEATPTSGSEVGGEVVDTRRYGSEFPGEPKTWGELYANHNAKPASEPAGGGMGAKRRNRIWATTGVDGRVMQTTDVSGNAEAWREQGFEVREFVEALTDAIGVKQKWALARKIYEARYPDRGSGAGALHWDAMTKSQRLPWLTCATVALTSALSSAPATPSPLPAGVDVHEEWQRRLKRNDFSDDDWSEWKACDERQVRDIQTLGHPSGFPFLNAEVRRVRITTAALSASAPAPEERADG